MYFQRAAVLLYIITKFKLFKLATSLTASFSLCITAQERKHLKTANRASTKFLPSLQIQQLNWLNTETKANAHLLWFFTKS